MGEESYDCDQKSCGPALYDTEAGGGAARAEGDGREREASHHRPPTNEEANLKCVPPFGIHSNTPTRRYSRVGRW